jgi:hypothetical protein
MLWEVTERFLARRGPIEEYSLHDSEESSPKLNPALLFDERLGASAEKPVVIKRTLPALPATVSTIYDGTRLDITRGSADTVGLLLEALILQHYQLFTGTAPDNLLAHVDPNSPAIGHGLMLAFALSGAGTAQTPLYINAIVPRSVVLAHDGNAIKVPAAGSDTVLNVLDTASDKKERFFGGAKADDLILKTALDANGLILSQSLALKDISPDVLRKPLYVDWKPIDLKVIFRNDEYMVPGKEAKTVMAIIKDLQRTNRGDLRDYEIGDLELSLTKNGERIPHSTSVSELRRLMNTLGKTALYCWSPGKTSARWS